MTKKIIIFSCIIFLISIVSWHLLSIYRYNKLMATSIQPLQESNIRPEIKSWINNLSSYDISTIKHTTQGINSAFQNNKKVRVPDKPKRFLAGRFKVDFIKNDEKKSVILQTEELVGHLGEIIPGQTKVGGYVQLLDSADNNDSSGPKLNADELNYFIRSIYMRFSQPLDEEQASLLNKTKDYSLAIMFSDKIGIDEYHNKLVQQIKNKD